MQSTGACGVIVKCTKKAKVAKEFVSASAFNEAMVCLKKESGWKFLQYEVIIDGQFHCI